MKIVGFLGAYDKTDLIIYVAKMLSITNKKVLVIDGTTEGKSRYIVPTINPTVSYVTNFYEIDVAIGFNNYTNIAEYLGKKQLDYDFILVDIDNYEAFENFKMKQAYKNYFVTSFSLYSIKKGLSILEQLQEPIKLSKILFSTDISNEENEYLNYLSLGYKVKWDEYRVYFPLEAGDQTAIIENEKLSRIKFKNLSSQYRESLQYITEELLGSEEINDFVKALRNFDKKD